MTGAPPLVGGSDQVNRITKSDVVVASLAKSTGGLGTSLITAPFPSGDYPLSP